MLLVHVDAEKSTIPVHLTVLAANVEHRTIEKFEGEAKGLKRESCKFEFALDTSDQEREKVNTEE